MGSTMNLLTSSRSFGSMPFPQPLLMIQSIRWSQQLSPGLSPFIHAFLRFFRKLTPDGTLERQIYFFLMHNLLAKFQAIWPFINPIAHLSKSLYYEFLIEGQSNEYRWIDHWLVNRPKMVREHRRVLVTTGNKPAASLLRASAREPQPAKEIREQLGYIGCPHADDSTWFTAHGGLFRARIQRYGVPASSPQDGPPPPLPQARPSLHPHEDHDLVVRLYATSRAPFLLWLAEAKKKFESAVPLVIRINHFVGTGWGAGPSRQKRSFEDVILPDETRIKLESLVSDFLKSGRWYSNRGLSWKKGILLHGPPGCGKTSTIVGLASKYDLKIHYLSLNHPHLTDESLAAAMRQVQPKSVVCLEDCDVWAKAHNRRLAEKAAAAAAGLPVPPIQIHMLSQPLLRPEDRLAGQPRGVSPPPPPPPPPESRLTLTGLLNVLDGVDEQKGILYILTSNDPSSLDAAMKRPGRIDAIIKLKHATRKQAEDLFKTFFKPYDEEQPVYDSTEVARLAKIFAQCVREEEFSPASLQTFLLEHRLDPPGAAAAMPGWVRMQREANATAPLADSARPSGVPRSSGGGGEGEKELTH